MMNRKTKQKRGEERRDLGADSVADRTWWLSVAQGVSNRGGFEVVVFCQAGREWGGVHLKSVGMPTEWMWGTEESGLVLLT